ncbi:hypothetical protein QAD02_014523 [Eretmocerus hayati]|uniref:Uncharacterized protein n=1 Tax=Eretmocerus hayati TaxID=131215 RepID=A0ACC2P6T6_9HYME|nr:hypothetical protein QAD02_014523 [Eretmocerus hayati]
MVNDDGSDFQLVTYNSRGRRKNPTKHNQNHILTDSFSVDEIVSKVQAALEKFKESPFHRSLLSALKDSLVSLNKSTIVDIVCFGLGHFSDSIDSKYQLAALLSIQATYSSNVYLYDPLFTKNEILSLKQLKLSVIDQNEEGRRRMNDCSTLVFMPHCSKQLTNNFLNANWSPSIHNCVLLGNSWSELECNTTNALLKQDVNFVYKLKEYATEINLQNNFHYPNTFSGTSLHIFTEEKLSTVPVGFWETNPTSPVIHSDPELITAEEIPGNVELL